MNRSLRNKLNYYESNKNVRDAGLTANTDLNLGSELKDTSIDSFGVDVISKTDYDCMDPRHKIKRIDFGSI